MTESSFNLIIEKLNSLEFDEELPKYKNKIISDLKLNDRIIFGNQFFVVFDHHIQEIIFTHKNIQEILGFQEKNISIKTLINYIYSEDKDLVLKAAKKIMIEGLTNHQHEPFDDVYCIEYRMVKCTTQVIWIRTEISTLIKDKNGIPLLTFVQFNDITTDTEPKEFKMFYCGKNAQSIKFPPCRPLVFKKGNCLTEQEKKITRLIVDGKTTKEVAQKLNISIGTVETHRNVTSKQICCIFGK
jgi:hypothetical protein